MSGALAGLAAATLIATPSAADLGLRPAFTRPLVPSRAPARAEPSRERLLELWVNGSSRNVIARVVEDNGDFLVANADLSAAGLAPPTADEGMTALSALGITGAQVSAATQQLILTTPPRRDLQVVSLGRVRGAVAPGSDTGVLVRYDLSALAGEYAGGWSVAAALAGSVFMPKGRLDGAGWLQADQDAWRFIRLETAMELADTERMRRLTLGDSTTSQLSWSRAMRFAGVQVARDFSLQPDLVTLPALDFLGQATAPSTVDVFVNAAKVYTGEVEPGPFQVRDLPAVTGRGEVVVVVEDALGRSVSTVLPLYGSTRLLGEGLTDYSFEAGVLRRGYGLESFAYGAPVAMASVRRGLNDHLTVEGYLEASSRTSLAGAGASFRLGAFGVGSAGLAASTGEAGDGLLYALSAEGELEAVRLFGAAFATSGDYQDIAGAYEGVPAPDLRVQLGAALDVGRRGALGASWVMEEGRDRSVELATASFSYSLPGGWYFGASGLYDMAGEAWAGQVFLRLPLSRDLSASTSFEVAGRQQTSRYAVSRRTDPDGGWGYTVQAAPEENRVQADASWYGAKASANASVLSDDGALLSRVLVSGALVGMDGEIFAARGSDGGFALVKTGHPGVQVFRENRPAAVTDEKGRALLAGLTPNTRNRISVAVTDFPLLAEIEAPVRDLAPRQRSGLIADFTPKPTHPALLVIRLADGSFPPLGALLVLEDGEQVVVGRRGQAYVRNLGSPAQARLRYGGTACLIELPGAPSGGGDAIPRLDAACRGLRR